MWEGLGEHPVAPAHGRSLEGEGVPESQAALGGGVGGRQRQGGVGRRGDGGLRELAERLGVRPKTLVGHLTSWRRTRPRMLQAYSGRKVGGVAPLLAVQVPVATDLVLWAALTRSILDAGDGRVPHPLLVADAAERLAMLGTTGPAYETWPLLDDAVGDLGAAIVRKGGDPPRRRLETGRQT